jgi:membrane protein implicated in regulation of membrane protease activity
MSYKDLPTENLVERRKKAKIATWIYAGLLILTMFFYTIEVLSDSTWRILFVGFIILSAISSLSHFKIVRELNERKDTKNDTHRAEFLN